MNINEIIYNGAQPIDGYGPGFFRIQSNIVNGAIVVTPSGVKEWDGCSASQISELADQIDVVLIGTGNNMRPPDSALLQALDAADIAVEYMATPSACRTYNMLVAEGRRVAAALYPLEKS